MPNLTPRINDLLNRVRGRIRRYVWIEGICLAIAWVALMFWIGLAIDYLPVKLGASEMPVAARQVLLAIVGLAFLYIIYRWVLRRAFVDLRDRSLAILIERKFPEFQESLVTTVELDDAEESSPAQTEMVRRAREQADRLAASVDERKVFNFWPMQRAIMSAVGLLASIAVLAALAWPLFGLGVKRLYGFSNQAYPRTTHLEMVGFADNRVTVARGNDLTIRVQADAERRTPPPDVCTIYYRTDDGERGRINMSKKGAPRNGFQQYTFDGKPFKAILDDIHFDVVGNDQRIRDQRVRVVDSPQVVKIDIRCERPEYTGLAATNIEYYPGVKLPRGSRLSVNVQTNKPLVAARLDLGSDEEPVSFSPSNEKGFSFPIEKLEESVSYELLLDDTDGVTSQRPYRISLVAIPDMPPNVAVRMQGIGSAITPDARIPMVGEITDDYGVNRSWFELEVDESTRDFELEVGGGGSVNSSLDLRAQRSKDEDPYELKPETKVILSVKSSDRYDLDELPNVGQSDRYELEVVTANRLVALLEARELGLRRRFEQIILEMRETRDSLSRVQFSEPPGDSTSTNPEEVERAAALRQLRVQRAEQQSKRAAQEVMGVALSFDDIRQELINNRVDASDRRERITRDIFEPLRIISEKKYPVLDERLATLNGKLTTDQSESVISSAAVDAVAQADEILLAMESVLEKMLDLETYTELVDLIRSMIKDQEDLTSRTESLRKKAALDLLK